MFYGIIHNCYTIRSCPAFISTQLNHCYDIAKLSNCWNCNYRECFSGNFCWTAAFKILRLPNTSVKIFLGKLELHNSSVKLLAPQARAVCIVLDGAHPNPISSCGPCWASSAPQGRDGPCTWYAEISWDPFYCKHRLCNWCSPCSKMRDLPHPHSPLLK